MIDQGYIYQNVFSLWLNKDPMAEIGGEIVFGGINSRHFRGEHTYVPISQKSYWQVNSRFRTSSLILLINHVNINFFSYTFRLMLEMFYLQIDQQVLLYFCDF
ncbi:hypothetical protein HN51_039938 [Arachis hypogaea]